MAVRVSSSRPFPLALQTVRSGPMSVADQIHGAIAQTPNRQITFCHFMELALYARPSERTQGGFFKTDARIGKDFTTNPESLSPDYGKALARIFPAMDRAMTCRDDHYPFTILEYAAGNGRLAADILDGLSEEFPKFYNRLTYILVDSNPATALNQSALLARHRDRARWVTGSAMTFTPGRPIRGAIISNEMLDNFPVHAVTVRQGRLQEIYVAANKRGEFNEVYGPVSDDAIRTYVNDVCRVYDFTLSEGERLMVNLNATGRWLPRVAGQLRRGYLLTIDTNFDLKKERQLGGQAVRTYRQKQHGFNPYISPGERDIMTDPHLKLLADRGEAYGLGSEGPVSEAALFSELAPFRPYDFEQIGMRCTVLIQSKNVVNTLDFDWWRNQWSRGPSRFHKFLGAEESMGGPSVEILRPTDPQVLELLS